MNSGGVRLYQWLDCLSVLSAPSWQTPWRQHSSHCTGDEEGCRLRQEPEPGRGRFRGPHHLLPLPVPLGTFLSLRKP